MKCGVWSVKTLLRLAEKIKRLSREGHGRDRLSLNYRSFMFGKLPPPACPGLCYIIYNIIICRTLYLQTEKQDEAHEPECSHVC